MDKSPDAFRTISEVADALETPAHVLRFWESRFPQIKPVKRAGGRRYYRPADVALLGGIRHLLHDAGMTIRGVQKILREQGVRHVAALAPGGDLTAFDQLDQDEDFALDLSASGEVPVDLPGTARVLAMGPTARRPSAPPDAPAEVVQLRAPVEVPDLTQGFMLPTANRRPLPTLDPEPPADDVPEAGHLWVEDSAPYPAEAEPLFPVKAAVRNLVDLDAPYLRPVETDAAEPLDAAQDDAGSAPDGSLQDLVAEAVQRDLFAEPDPAPESRPLPEMPGVGQSPELSGVGAAPAGLSGLAARLRALPRPLSPASVTELTELHMRLGLLHAQMVEAQRPRR